LATNYTAVIQQDGEWWIGWVEEVPGVNSQGNTREELLDNLRDALEEALEMNRVDASTGGSQWTDANSWPRPL
jgi:predicted RNase H-like HicB family nuclease